MATCNLNSGCNIVVDNDESSNLTTDRKRKTESETEGQAEQSPTKKQRELPKSSPKFTVTYSRGCDGGAQEMSTAVAAVRDIFPDATIRTNRRNQEDDIGVLSPSVVISATTTILGGSGINLPNNSSKEDDVLWSSKQRNLYQKYPKKRRRSIKDIRKKLEILKTSLQTTEPATDIQSALQTIESATSASTDSTACTQVAAPARKVSLEHETRPTDADDEESDCIGSCPIMKCSSLVE